MSDTMSMASMVGGEETSSTTDSQNDLAQDPAEDSGTDQGAIGSTESQTSSTETGETSSETEEPTWWYAEGVPGVGEKPDYFEDGTFKTLADQAKNQKELRKKMATFEGAPDDYVIDLGEEFADYEINPEDPVIAGLQKYAKENNMPQKNFDDAVRLFAKLSIDTETNEDTLLKEHFKKEIASLGSDGEKQVDHVVKWLEATLDNFDITKDQDLLMSAHAIRRLQELQKKTSYQKVPTSTQSHKPPVKSRIELDQMLNDPKYLKDPIYQKEVDDMWKAAYGNK